MLIPEWAPQKAVLISWPTEKTDWKSNLSQATQCYKDLVIAITQHQSVIILVDSTETERFVRADLIAIGIDLHRVDLIICPYNDTWTRDYGPLAIYSNNHSLKFLNFKFNAWGGKFSFNLDDQVNETLLKMPLFNKVDHQSYSMTLEGGSIESNGLDTILTTSQCLLTDSRNQDPNKQDIELKLCKYFGCSHILWLDHGYLHGDDTDSHIDTLARFCNHDTICYVRCDDPTDEHYPELKAMEDQLKSFQTSSGLPYNLIPLPMPKARFNNNQERLPATYANFLIINDAVILPIYQCPEDKTAISTLEKCFPDRQILPINANALIEQNGSIHCVTMQIPDIDSLAYKINQ